MTSPARLNPNYGKGDYTIEPDADDIELPELKQWLNTFLELPKVELPRPPLVAMEIYELSRQPNVSLEKIAGLLEHEPLLAARVLRLANSPIYRGVSPSTTLKQALVRVGIKNARDLVMEAALQITVIRAPGFEETLESIRHQSTAVAYVSRLVARRTPMEAENAFLIGLLHHIGLSVGLAGLCEFLKRKKKEPVLRASSWAAVQTVHEAYGERVLKSWKLEPALTIVVANHHRLLVGGQPHPSVGILQVATTLSANAGWKVMPVLEGGVEFDSELLPTAKEHEQALSVLMIDPAKQKALGADVEAALTQLAGQLHHEVKAPGDSGIDCEVVRPVT